MSFAKGAKATPKFFGPSSGALVAKSMAIPRQEMDQALKEGFAQKLRIIGFKGSYPHFRREGPEYIELVGVQFSQWGAQFYLEAGVAEKTGVTVQGKLISANKLKHYHAWQRRRFGDLPFDYEAHGIAESARKAEAIVEDIEKWFAEKGYVSDSLLSRTTRH